MLSNMKSDTQHEVETQENRIVFTLSFDLTTHWCDRAHLKQCKFFRQSLLFTARAGLKELEKFPFTIFQFFSTLTPVSQRCNQ